MYSYLRIAHFEKNTTLLGPFSRSVIWVHGCCFHCEGCLAENMKYGPYHLLSATELGDKILAQNDIEGITISGGEPFLQAQALVELINYIKSQRDLGVIIYSGFTLAEIQSESKKKSLLDLTDILIDGQYMKEHDDGRPYVGSSNQKIHCLSERYRHILNSYYTKCGRKAEIKISSDGIVLIGVPSKEVLDVWNDLKSKAGGKINDFTD